MKKSNIFVLFIILFFVPYGLFAGMTEEPYYLVPPIQDSYEVIPLEAKPPNEYFLGVGESRDWLKASSLNDHGIAIGFKGVESHPSSYWWGIDNIHPQIWTFEGNDSKYFIGEDEALTALGGGGSRDPVVNNKGVIIYKANNILQVYIPLKMGALIKHYQVQLRDLHDKIVYFDEEGNLFVSGYSGSDSRYKKDDYVQNISDAKGINRKFLNKEIAQKMSNGLYSRVTTLMKLHTTLKNHIASEGWNLTGVVDVNRKGQYLAYADFEGQSYIVVLNPL